MADVFRIITILLLMLVVSLFPRAVRKQGGQPSAWLAVIGAELAWAFGLIEIGTHLGTKIVWHRTPVMFISAVVTLGFIYNVLTKGNNAQNQTRKERSGSQLERRAVR